MSVSRRLLDRSVLVPFCGCRLWEGHVNVRTGYGEIKVDGKVEYTHRAAYRAFKGEPGPLHVLHSCDVRSCINPDHLFLGTNADNIADSVNKGRRKGIKRANDYKLKLPRERRAEIVARFQGGETSISLGHEIGFHPASIRKLARELK